MPRSPLLSIMLLWAFAAPAQAQPANGPDLVWRGRHSPTGRIGHQLAYFPPQRRTLLFGGGAGRRNDTAKWFWNGHQWTEEFAPEVGPFGRWFHSMAYDANRKVVVLFGGSTFGDGAKTFTDTWEWDGHHWELLVTEGPSRNGAMVFDDIREVMVMQASTTDLNGDFFGETWEWDGVSWTLRHTGGPLPSGSSSAVFDSARGVMVLWGTLDEQSLAFETWEWDGSDWSLRASNGPSPRAWAALAYDPDRGVTVLFGGIENFYSQITVNDTWEWDGIEWVEREIPGPPRRWLHTMTYDSHRGVSILYGGAELSPTGNKETWEYDGQAWINVTPTTPGPLVRHAMAFDSRRGQTVLFGGNRSRGRFPEDAELSGQTWEWDGLQWCFRAETGPAPRQSPAMAYDPRRGVTLMGGGATVRDGEWIALPDTWEWDGESWLQRAVDGPDFGRRPLMAYDFDRRVTVLLGGTGTWEWDGHTWDTKVTWDIASLNDAALAYDYRPKAVVWMDAGIFSIGLFQWDGSGWRRLAGNDIEVFQHFTMTFDRRRKTLVAYGPINFFDTQSDYLWEWDGLDLIPSVLGPSTRWDHAMVYDSIRGVLVIYGGFAPFLGPRISSSLWEYGQDRPASAGIGQSER